MERGGGGLRDSKIMPDFMAIIPPGILKIKHLHHSLSSEVEQEVKKMTKSLQG